MKGTLTLYARNDFVNISENWLWTANEKEALAEATQKTTYSYEKRVF